MKSRPSVIYVEGLNKAVQQKIKISATPRPTFFETCYQFDSI